MPQAQAVAQVQTGLQLQLQFWQLQEALDETVDLVGFVFMDDLVSTMSTEALVQSYKSGKVFWIDRKPAVQSSGAKIGWTDT